MQKMVWCRGEKVVLVTVYIIKPTRRKASSNTNHHHHHHHHHHRPTLHSSVGYNRKAELLQYAQHLRALAHGATTLGYRITCSNTPEKKSNKFVPVSHKSKYRRTPTCLGDWKKILLPNFVLRSLASFQEKKRRRKKGSESTGSKMSTMVKSITAQKQGLVKKLLSVFPKQK